MRSNLVKNGLLAVGSVLFFLALLEGLCRLFPVRQEAVDVDKLNRLMMNNGESAAIRFVADPELGYRMVVREPDPEIFEDAWGRRHARRKPARTLRVVCVGGSTTYGTGADPATTFPALLEELFNRSFPDCQIRVEVINASMMGYNSWHSRIRAPLELDSLTPDLYVVMDGLNDTITSMSTGSNTLGDMDVLTSQVNLRRGPLQNALKSLARGLEHSALYGRLRHAYKTLAAGRESGDQEIAGKVAGFGYDRNMEEFILGRREKGIPTALLNYPWIIRPSADFASEANRVVFPLDRNYFRYFQAGRAYVARTNIELSRRLGATLIDPQPMMDELTRDGANLYRYFSDTVHFTRFGNFYIALSLFDVLKNTEPFQTAFRDCPRRDLDPVIASLWSQVFLPEHALMGEGFPQDPTRGYDTLVESTDNVAVVPADVEGWTMFTVQDLARPGTLVLARRPGPDPEQKRTNGFNCVVYPRFAADLDAVTLRGGDATVLEARKTFPGPQWSPIAERYGCVLPREATRIVVTLMGRAQLWRYGERVLFYNPF